MTFKALYKVRKEKYSMPVRIYLSFRHSWHTMQCFACIVLHYNAMFFLTLLGTLKPDFNVQSAEKNAYCPKTVSYNTDFKYDT